eukprot:106951-Pyramimonas_sp.AAC.1
MEPIMLSGGLWNAKVASSINRCIVAVGARGNYIGIGVFVLFAVRYRARATLWRGDNCEDALRT